MADRVVFDEPRLIDWQVAWREGFLPGISTQALEALRDALERDDQRLMQGGTCYPSPMAWNAKSWPVGAACAVGYCGWHNGEGIGSVEEVEEFFARLCYDADQRLGEPAGCRYFLNWFDEKPRDFVFTHLLAEVLQNLEDREAAEADQPVFVETRSCRG